MVWHAAQWLVNAYSPGANLSAGASAYERVGFAAVCQLFSHDPIVVARNFGLSTPELRSHCPVASLPTSRCGVWPSGSFGFGGDQSPVFRLTRSMSSALPVRNSQPGPASNVLAYSFSTAAVSCSGSIVTE